MISGVSAGLGHYFGIDAYGLEYSTKVGTGVLAYIILWIVVPCNNNLRNWK
jgi:phage shock protein PspC (stress-responsive transcriptional regulator)